MSGSGRSGRAQDIARAFGRAASGYDRAAGLQRRVARLLADRVAAALADHPAPRVVEVGCGTGYLSAVLAERLPRARFLFTDLAPDMVARAAQRLGADPRWDFAVMDGQALSLDRAADAVVSSLALQWFADPASALAGWADALAPKGRLLFTTLGAGTLAEWRAAHRRLGLACGTPDYPPAQDLAALLPGLAVDEAALAETYADSLAFLRMFKAIGAHLPAPGHRPLPPAALKRVLAELGPGAVTLSWRVLFGEWRRG